MGVFNTITKVNSYLSMKNNIKSLAKEVARIIRHVTGFDRVLIYEVLCFTKTKKKKFYKKRFLFFFRSLIKIGMVKLWLKV